MARRDFLERPTVRYGFAVATVALAFVLRTLLEPLTGTGAPFVLFFGAILATGLVMGPRPGIVAALLSIPLGASFTVRQGFAPDQVATQVGLFAIDAAVVVYLSFVARRAQRTAERATQRVQELLDLAPDAVIVTNPTGEVADVNQATCRLLAYERAQLVGKPLRELLPADEHERLAADRAALRLRSQAIRREWSMRRSDGTLVPVEVSATILPDRRGHAFIRDITERKRVEDERRVHLALLDSSSDFIAIAAIDGRLIYINPAGRSMIGLPLDVRVEQTRIPDYFLEPDRAVLEALAKRLSVEGHVSTEISLRNWQTGDRVPFASEHFLIRDVTGTRVLGRGLIAHDISEARRIASEREQLLASERLARERAEAVSEQLRESEERFRLTIDEAPIGMALVALDGRFVRVNRALCEIVGYAKDELERLTFQDITYPDDLATDLEPAGQLARGEIPSYQLEKRYVRKDGSIVTIMIRASVLRSRDGTPLHYVAQIEDITERKRAEEALRASERDFRSLAESMPQIVWATDAAGLNIYFNQQWVDYTGLSFEESGGEGWILPVHPDDRQRVWDAWQRATRYRDSYSLECRLRRADGVYQWWLIRGVPLLGADGEILKWFGTCTDIEEIKLTEQKLQESEAKFSGIISISADAIISIDDEQRITIFNHGAEQIFGYSQAEAIGTPLERLIPGRLGRMRDRLTTIAGVRKNGEEFPAEAAISKLQVGEKTLLTVALRDVSERKRIEKEQQFLAEAGVVLAASLDYEQTLATLANLVVRDLADWCIVEVIEQHDVRRLKVASRDPSKSELGAVLEQVPLDRERPYLLRALLDTKRPLLVENVTAEHLESVAQGPEHLQVLRAVSPTSIMAVPLLGRGQLLGILAFLSSGPRHYGRGDLRLAEALADRAAVAIENARLYNASVEATQIRDQVLGFVAHDLRNPLAAITMQAGLLVRSGPEPERRSRKPVGTIQRAATRMNRLIQDILDVSRMEGGHLSVEQHRVPTEQVISESVAAQQPLAASASIDLHVDLEAGVSDVWADRDRVLQVFENLIGNAVRYTKPGGRITAGAASHDGEVMFWVKDTGAGIPAEEMPHVFDRFWQARKTRRAGAGLGLQIVKGIVEAHGGRIWADSTEGVGTTFYFTLPTARAAGAQPTPAEMH